MFLVDVGTADAAAAVAVDISVHSNGHKTTT
jgi:hypothetical protein